MLNPALIELKLRTINDALFQRLCDAILVRMGFEIYNKDGTAIAADKTRAGTPDSTYLDNDGKYVFAEYTTVDAKNLAAKAKGDIEKCLNEVSALEPNRVSKILFIHNRKNLKLACRDELERQCSDYSIKFESWGIDKLTGLLSDRYSDIAFAVLGVVDPSCLNIIRTGQTNNATHKRVEELYRQAQDIMDLVPPTNKLSEHDRLDLKKIRDNLLSCQSYYSQFSSGNLNTELFFRNLLLIDSALNGKHSENLFKTFPSEVKSLESILLVRAQLLIGFGELTKANSILNTLVSDGYMPALSALIQALYLQGRYDEIKQIMDSTSRANFDSRGTMAAIYIESSNMLKAYKEQKLLELCNNGRFRKMPLVHFCIAKLLKNNGSTRSKWKRQFTTGLWLLDDDDVQAIHEMCKIASCDAILLDLAINHLLDIEQRTSAVNQQLLFLLLQKDNLSLREQEELSHISLDHLCEEDKNLAEARILDLRGELSAAAERYRVVFANTGNEFAAGRYLTIANKYGSRVDEAALSGLAETSNTNIIFLMAKIYSDHGKYVLAARSLYKIIYKERNNMRAKLALWDIIAKHNDTICRADIRVVEKNTVISLKRVKRGPKRTVILEDDKFFSENSHFYGAKIARSDSETGFALIGAKIGDEVEVGDNTYEIIAISTKPDFLAKKIAPSIMGNHKYIHPISGNNIREVIHEITNFLQTQEDKKRELFHLYEQGKANIPVSMFCTSPNFSAEEQTRLYRHLLYNSEAGLFAGESKDIAIRNGLVLDMSAILVMAILGILKDIPETWLRRFYITESTKHLLLNRLDTLMEEPAGSSETIGLYGGKLFISKTTNREEIKFWKEIVGFIERINIEDTEATYDILWNAKHADILCKAQFDAIALAKERGLPFVCDELAMRNISHCRGVSSTNSSWLSKKMLDGIDDERFGSYINSNYIYSLWAEDLLRLIINGALCPSSKQQSKYKTMLLSLLDGQIRSAYYAPVLSNIQDTINTVIDEDADEYLNTARLKCVSMIHEILEEHNRQK